MNIARIDSLASLLSRHGLSELVCRDGADEIAMKRFAESVGHQRSLAASQAVLSPWVGRLLWRNPNCPDEAPADGDTAAGSAIAWVAVGPLLRPVRITVDARAVRRELPEGAIVGYGDTLAFIEPLNKD